MLQRYQFEEYKKYIHKNIDSMIVLKIEILYTSISKCFIWKTHKFNNVILNNYCYLNIIINGISFKYRVIQNFTSLFLDFMIEIYYKNKDMISISDNNIKCTVNEEQLPSDMENIIHKQIHIINNIINNLVLQLKKITEEYDIIMTYKSYKYEMKKKYKSNFLIEQKLESMICYSSIAKR